MPRRHFKYSDELIDSIEKLKAQDLTWGEIGKRLGVPAKKIKDAYLGRAKRRKAAVASPDFLARAAKLVPFDVKQPPDWQRCLKGMVEAQDFRGDFSISLRRAVCRIETDKPIALTAITDVHLGSPHTDYGAFEQDISRVIADPRFFVLKGGDWADKFNPSFKDAAAPSHQLAPVEIQLVTVDQIMKALSGRIIAAIGGNHDRMDEKKVGSSSEYWIHRDKDFPYMPTGGLIELIVGDTTYRILWTHQYGAGNSRLNKHNVFRWLRSELDSTADIYILEHHHDPSILTHEIEEFQHRAVVEVRTGTYKIDDPYSQQFFKAGRRGPQTLILWPDRHKIAAMHGQDAIEDATHYLDGVYHGGKKAT